MPATRVLCAVCQEPLSYIMFPDPGSHQSSPMTWPERGVMAMADGVLVHVLGDEVHYARLIEGTEHVLGNPKMGTLDSLANMPVEDLRFRGMRAG